LVCDLNLSIRKTLIYEGEKPDKDRLKGEKIGRRLKGRKEGTAYFVG